MITSEVIKNLNSAHINYIRGPLDRIAEKVLPPNLARDNALVFTSTQEHFNSAIEKKASVIVFHSNIDTQSASPDIALFETAHIQMAMSAILPLFDGKMNRFIQEEKIHPTSIIHPSAHIGKNVFIGPYVIIGENTQIGDHTTIGSHCVIENNVHIGDHCLLHPTVFIGAQTIIGHHTEIHPHTTIGSDGFGFAIDRAGIANKIPQIGRVIIGNHVEIGANCTIDRAALTETIIHDGVKVDNLCHFGHNTEVGDHSLITAGFFIAGSSKVGKHFVCGGNTAISDHKTVTDKVTVAGRSTVGHDITEPGQYGGYPIQPMRTYLKTQATLPNISDMKKQIAKILKHLQLDKEVTKE